MTITSFLTYASEASAVLLFLVTLPGAMGAARKRIRERRRAYRPRHARTGRRLEPPRN